MSKFFKYLGIGSAIGVIVYGVIKYKNDQKFKEKVDEVVNKVEEKADKALIKASDFINDHPGLFVTTIFAVTFIPAVVHAVNIDKQRQEMMQQAYDDFKTNWNDEECNRINETAADTAKRIISEHYGDDNVDLNNYLIVPKDDYEKYQKAYETKSDTVDPPPEIFNNWKEEYRDTWDEVHELSNRITLAPGESYMIEEPRQLGLDTDQHVISHMIYGEGCYPPDVKDDQFIPRRS